MGGSGLEGVEQGREGRGLSYRPNFFLQDLHVSDIVECKMIEIVIIDFVALHYQR